MSVCVPRFQDFGSGLGISGSRQRLMDLLSCKETSESRFLGSTLLPFHFRVLLLKLNIRKKGTLIIKVLLRNLDILHAGSIFLRRET